MSQRLIQAIATARSRVWGFEDFFPSLDAGSIRENLAGRMTNVLLAIAFLIPASLILAAFFVLNRIVERDGGPFLYRGIRLGKDKKPFTIYKIRTLAMGAEDKLGADLCVPNNGLELTLGRFLRSTRLDELPQLINILKGDMNFIGPRPDRPAVYERIKQTIPGYDRRFEVLPGLTGYSQFFTPHNTPKRIRYLLDQRFIAKEGNYLDDLAFVMGTGLRVALNTGKAIGLAVLDHLRSNAGTQDLRKTRRVRARHVSVSLCDGTREGLLPAKCEIHDINHEAFMLVTEVDLSRNDTVHLVMDALKTRSNKRKRARCKGIVESERRPANGNGESRYYVIFYEPISDLNRYIVDQYILRNSIA